MPGVYIRNNPQLLVMWKRLFCCGAESTTHVAEKPRTKRKTPIPASLRSAVWNTYLGDHVAKTKCPVCNTNDITPFTFQCGHVVAESLGGPTNLDNLRPICAPCNVSSQKRNMNEFKKAHFGEYPGCVRPSARLPQNPFLAAPPSAPCLSLAS